MAEDNDRSYEIEFDDSDSINTNSSNELDDEEPGEDVQQVERAAIEDAINRQPKRVSYAGMPEMKSFEKVNLDGKFTGYVRCNECTDKLVLMRKRGTHILHLHGHIGRFHKQDPDYYDSTDDQKEELHEMIETRSNRIMLQAPPSNNNYLKGYRKVFLDGKFTNYFKCLLCPTMNLIKSDGDTVEGRINVKKHQRRAHSGKRRSGADKSAKKSEMKQDNDVDSIGSNFYIGNGDNGSIKTNGGNIGVNQPEENVKLVEKAVIENAINNNPKRVRYKSAGTPRFRSFKKVYLDGKFTGFMKCDQCSDKLTLIRKQGESTKAFERHISHIHDSKTPKLVQSKTNGPPIVTQPHEDSSSSSEEEQTTTISSKKPRTRDVAKKYPVRLVTQAESSRSEDEEPAEPITLGIAAANAPQQVEQRQPELLAVEQPSTSRKRGHQSRSGDQPSTSSRKRGNETDDDYDNLIKKLKVKKLQSKIKESELMIKKEKLMIQKEELLIEEKRLKIDHYKKVDQGFGDIMRAAKVIISLGSDGLREQSTDRGPRKSTSK